MNSLKNYRRLLGAALFICSGCVRLDPSGIASATLPGSPIISFPNGADRTDTTILLSKPTATVAGIDGRVFTISSVLFDKPQDELTVDAFGNMGLHGTYHSLSLRASKKQIEVLRASPLGIVDRTQVVTFRYVGELDTTAAHIGIIADDAPAELTGGDHKSFDINASLAVSLAATRELHAEVIDLRRELNELRRTLARRKTGAFHR